MPAVPRPFLHGTVIALIVLATYAASVRGAFVSDDIPEVATKQLIRSLDADHLLAMFRSFDGPNYMPLNVLSFAVDYHLWGLEPTGFHLTNLLIHTLNALLIYTLLVKIELDMGLAFVAALIWAVHPLQVESVAWISERKNVLSGFFFFAAFYCYVLFSARPRVTTYLGVSGLYTLALLSKMNTMVLPAICLAYEIAFRFRLRARDVLAAIPLLAMGAFAAWYNISGNPIHGGDYWGGSALVSGLSSTVVVFWYAGNLLWPTRLCTFYDVPLHGSVLDVPVLLSVLGLAVLSALALYLIATKRRAGFWIVWFGITLAPMLNIVPFRSMMNDRYMYLPMLGPVVLLTGAVRAGMGLVKLRYVPAVLAGAAIVGCVGLSYRRVGVWADALTLWQDWALRQYYLPADPVYRQPDFNHKLKYLQDVTARYSSSPAARNGLGALYFESGDFERAIPELEAALKLDPGASNIAANLGKAYAYAHRFGEAKELLERAVALDPYSFTAELTLARVNRIIGDLDGAQRAYEACARLRPKDFNTNTYWRPEHEYLKELQAARERRGHDRGHVAIPARPNP
jgi:hypothetical protein